MSHSTQYLEQSVRLIRELDPAGIEAVARSLAGLRKEGGRLFFLGVGGSAANASHAVNDFRKIAGMECYAPTDNVSELSARVNDEGWEGSFAAWLRTSRLKAGDAVFVLSVGGGNVERQVSTNIVAALRFAKESGAEIYGIVGRDGGYTACVGDHVLLIPDVEPTMTTFHAESFQSVLLHCLVSHPLLKAEPTKWESLNP